ncbi:methyl-accepting chemotaxis protein [Oikeobacillus pervagus]|uniref:Methyl-accepting chemotaxis protein n=1 Tax=Oikeobacillus pervagus TaxID=1325931 RepID=A0AAJ1T290_9BACI|nr:methyl-accepting chemotaxis protein [Oikeobacillus pervagus]MDQ0215351.1 methyl-accepting chemotaxis protein [Oikeobacillus pervagus]
MAVIKERKGSIKGLSIRTKGILFLSASVLLAVAITVIFNYITISDILKKDDMKHGVYNAKNAAAFVEKDLGKYDSSIKQMASLLSLQMNEEGFIGQMEKEIKSIRKEDPMLTSVYFMDFTTGKLHISPYAKVDKDVRETKSYRLLKEHPETTWVGVYKDIVTSKMMTSVITPVFSKGNMVGALGYDIDLSNIALLREKIEKESNSKLIILDDQGFIISSFIENADGKNMNPEKSGTVEGVEDLIEDSKKFHSAFSWVNEMNQKSPNTSHDFSWNGEKYKRHSATIFGLNWNVISLTPEAIFFDKISKFQKVSGLSILVGLAIGVIFAIIIAWRLNKLIRYFQTVIGKTAEGDLVSELEIHSKDELGQLAVSYNEMLYKMRQLIFKITTNVSSVNHAAEGLTTIANENNQSIEEITQAVEEIAVGTGNQTGEIDKGTKAIHDLSGQIGNLLNQSNQIEFTMKDAANEIDSGNRQVGNLEKSYCKLEQSFEKVTEMISKFDERSHSITRVTKAIEQIAEQTNLLSLNASIEAARAGEHGKGFAVVANEVRNLAEESKRAANDIHDMAKDMVVNTKELVEVMNETNTISIDQKDAVRMASAAMDKLTESLQSMMGSIEEEMHSIHSIQEEKEMVVKMIEEISAVSQQTTASTEEISSAMEEQAASTNEVTRHAIQLNQLIEELNGALRQFQIK